MADLYNTLSELCSQQGVTGYRMCKDLGLALSTMTDLKKGRKKGFSAEIAAKIANYFGVSVDYLLGNTDIKKASGEKPEGIVEDEDNDIVLFNREARKMTPEQRKKLLEMAKIMFGEAYNDEPHK